MGLTRSMYDRVVDFQGRKVVLPSDPDQIVFINDKMIMWDGVTSLTNEEKIELLKYYHQDKMKPKEERDIIFDMFFLDGSCGSSIECYGDGISFDDEGNPIVEIRDGLIKSSRVICPCEIYCIREVGGTNIRKVYYETTRKLNKCDLFERSTEGFLGRFYVYKCKLCGDEWVRRKKFRSYPARIQIVNKKWERYKNHDI